jgi:hypothetical protein
MASNLPTATDQDNLSSKQIIWLLSVNRVYLFRRITMKMTALQSQVYYPLEVNADRRISNNQLSTQQHQMCCFQNELVSDNFGANGLGTTTTTGQTEERLIVLLSPNPKIGQEV